MSDLNNAKEKHIIDYLMHAATRTDIANLDAKIDREISSLDRKIDRSTEIFKRDLKDLSKEINKNFRWGMGLMLTIMIGGFLGVSYQMVNIAKEPKSPTSITEIKK